MFFEVQLLLLETLSGKVSTLLYNLTTLFHFTRSDFITIVFPISAFSYGSAPLCSANKLSYAVQASFWTWLHLLHFNIANQTHDPSEDELNKPWRPLPIGRITSNNAMMVRWACMMTCFALSLYYSITVFLTSVVFSFLLPLYHEYRGDSHWLMKNILNALGYTCFATGSTLISGCNREQVDQIAQMSTFIMAGILMTTVHAQDFRDVSGDTLIGRKTIPIVFPELSRYSMVIPTLWSLYLVRVWNLDIISGAALVVFALYIGGRFYFYRSVKKDRRSYELYNIWIGISFSLGGYYRFFRLITAE